MPSFPTELNSLTASERDLLDAAVRACRCDPLEATSRAQATSRPPVRLPSADAIEGALTASIIGQDHVAHAVAETLALRRAGLDLNEERPAGVFLFTGPTGVGKTEFARCLATVLTGRDDRLLRLDCSEYSEPHQAMRLTGAPPSYLGYGASSPIEEFLRDAATGVILFDEFEKADPALHQMCLQIFDAGRLTTSAGKTLKFSRFVIVATTNVRARSTKEAFGFSPDAACSPHGGRAEGVPPPPMFELKRVFPLELLNRFDEIVAFRVLGSETARRILRERLLPAASYRLRRSHGVDLELAPSAEEAVLASGFSEEFGARHLQRAFAAVVLHAVAEAVTSLPDGCAALRVSVVDGAFRANPMFWRCIGG